MLGAGTDDAWLSCTLSALSALSDLKYDAARSLFGDALASAERLPSDDPRRAAALNNLGLSELGTGRQRQAVEALRTAQNQWQIASAWVEGIEIPFAAGSSMFHFLLAANHPETVARLRRNKYLILCAGAAAMTNALYDQAMGNALGGDRTRAQINAIKAAFGEDAVEARFLAEIASLSSPTRRTTKTQSLEERWRPVSRNTVVEMRPLVDAAYLTVGLRPEHLKSAPAQPG